MAILAGLAAAIGALIVCGIGVEVLDRLYAPGGALYSSAGPPKALVWAATGIILGACVGAFRYTSEAVKRQQAKAKASDIHTSTK